jgi:CheY-like chemotaxis protein/DNA-directed RNA polymerase subunit RPC12/RpoP
VTSQLKAKCPACGTTFGAVPDAGGAFSCPQCGIRLKANPAPAQPAPAVQGVENADMLAELRALRRSIDEVLRLQGQIWAALSSPVRSGGTQGPPATPTPSFIDDDETARAPIRSRRRRKTVLYIDDDEQTRAPALAAMEEVQIPVRAVGDGNAALAAVAQEKPDVIVMELGISGSIGGKDVINMIKATMEWVDIPIVFYTRVPMGGQKEARTVHGGDEWVPKGPGGPEQLVQRVIQIFQKA